MVTNSRVEQVAAKRDSRVLTARVDATVTWAAKEMKRNSVGCLVVVDETRKVLGILTERDIISKVVAEEIDCATVNVGEAMTTAVISIGPSASISEAQKIMARHHIRHLPIIHPNGTLLGVISSRDVLEQQLHTVSAIARMQTRILQDLETEHPGITNLKKDACGRIVI